MLVGACLARWLGALGRAAVRSSRRGAVEAVHSPQVFHASIWRSLCLGLSHPARTHGTVNTVTWDKRIPKTVSLWNFQ
jgi:hypothetical protein